MSNIHIFQISFEIWGCVISIIICLLLGSGSFEGKDIAGKQLWRIILVNNFLLVSDSLAYIYRGDMSPIGMVMTRVCNFLLFMLEDLLLAIFVRYVRTITDDQKSKFVMWWEALAYALLGASFTGLVITQFTGFYYAFDATNRYQRGVGIGMSFAACAAVILICVARLWTQRKKLSKDEKSTFLLCVLIIFICIAVQFLFYGLSLINVGMTIVFLLMYLRHYKMQYDAHMARSLEEAIRDTEALCAWKSASGCAPEQSQEVPHEGNQE